MNAIEYFNLNAKPVTEADAYIFFAYRRGGKKQGASNGRSAMPWWEQFLMYAGVVVGVMFSSAVINANSAGLAISWRYVVWACIVGLVLMPTVFRKLNVKPNAPLIVRLGLFVQNGVFWQTLVQAVGKSIHS
jgi:hypothetical protein